MSKDFIKFLRSSFSIFLSILVNDTCMLSNSLNVEMSANKPFYAVFGIEAGSSWACVVLSLNHKAHVTY